MHPLSPDLSSMKDDELQKNYNDLYQKYLVANRFGNSSVIFQMQILIEDYREEMAVRQRRQLEQNQDKHKLQDLIKVDK